MKTQDHELMIMYHPETTKGRQTVALAHTIAEHVAEWDFEKKPLTASQWREMLDMLHMEPKDLLDKSLPDYQKHIKGRDFDDESWLTVLQRNHHLIKGPIVLKGRHAKLCVLPGDIFAVIKEMENQSAA